MSVIGAAPVFARSRPGTWTIGAAAGLNPSSRFQAVGSIWTPLAFFGIDAWRRASRRPVGLLRSATVQRSFGYGSEHSPAAIGSHVAGSAIFNEPDYADVIARMKAAIAAG